MQEKKYIKNKLTGEETFIWHSRVGLKMYPKISFWPKVASLTQLTKKSIFVTYENRARQVEGNREN